MTTTNAEVACYRTSVSEIREPFSTLRGYPVDELAQNTSFTETMYLAIVGEFPTAAQRSMLDRILVLEVAHGVAPSGAVARSMIACGSPIQAALAAGALTVGDVHGGAGEQVGRFLQEGAVRRAREIGVEAASEVLVDSLLAQGGRVAGYGHQWHKDGDPRAPFLLEAASALGVAGTACALVIAMEKSLARRKGRRIPINVDGAIAAILTDMGIDWRYSRPIMIVGRAMTLAALAVEEMEAPSKQWRQLMVPAEVYDGPGERPVPLERD